MPASAGLCFLELGWLKEGRGQRVCVVEGRGHNGAWSLLPLSRPPVEGRAPGRVTKRFTRAHEDLVAPQILGPWGTPFAHESWQPDRTVLEAAHLAQGEGPGARCSPGQAEGLQESWASLQRRAEPPREGPGPVPRFLIHLVCTSVWPGRGSRYQGSRPRPNTQSPALRGAQRGSAR